MKALVTKSPGGFLNSAIVEAPEPTPGPDQVLLEIDAVGLNPADGFLIEGRYPGGPRPPFTVGRDAAGVVLRPDQQNRWPAGSRVVVLQSTATNLAEGTLCERQRVSADCLAPLPADWSMEEGAAAPLVYQTAWRGLSIFGNAGPGKNVVITGASGGVGTAGVQLAAGLGANVVGLSRSPEKRQRLLEIGAHHAFDPADPDLKKKVQDALGKSGADVVLETVGGPMLTMAVHFLGKRGMVAVVGVLAGVEGTIPIPSLMFKEASIKGVVVSDYEPAEARQAWEDIVGVLGRGGRRPIIDSVHPLDQYAAAFDRLRASSFGKIVVKCKG